MLKIRRIIMNGGEAMLESWEDADPGPHDYGVSRSAWFRAIKFVRRFGVDQALDVIDGRAMRAGDRHKYDISRRWRELITAIHAMTEEERLPGESVH